MRIGFYHDDLPIPGRKPGGVSVLVHRLARELTSRGHELTVWTRSPAPADAEYRHIRLWPRVTRRSRLFRTFGAPLLLNSVDWRDIEVLHLHGDDYFMFHRPVPTVRTLYGSALFEARYATRWRRRASQIVIAGLELLSARLATGCYGLGPGPPSIYATAGSLDGGVEIPGAVAVDRDGPPAVLFVGTWEGRKRGRFLHRVFAEQVRPRLPDAELWMVSDRSAPSPGVIWLGSPSDQELLKLYGRAWVMCMPSTYEGLGMPYLEAMAVGTPVVSSPNPGARYVLGPELAASSLVRDEGLGAALLGLLTNEGERRRRAEQGVVRVERFSWNVVAERHVEAYRRAIRDFRE